MALAQIRREALLLQTTRKESEVYTQDLWCNGNHDTSWKAIESSDSDVRQMLLEVLLSNSSGNPEILVSGYLSHIH